MSIRAREQHEREQAEYLEAREAKAKASGKKPGGKPPKPPTAGPGPSDQINLLRGVQAAPANGAW